MTETLPTGWRDHELHWHAHLRTNTSTAKLRRNYSPDAVLLTPQTGAEWVAEMLTAHSAETIAIEWHTPWGVTLDGPGRPATGTRWPTGCPSTRWWPHHHGGSVPARRPVQPRTVPAPPVAGRGRGLTVVPNW